MSTSDRVMAVAQNASQPVSVTDKKKGASRALRIGIPQALLFYKYGVLWQTFFEEMGFEVILSQPTDKEVYEIGDRQSVDECCLASKVYMGHVANLVGRCDAIFVPGYASCAHRAGFCTKYQSLPDLVRLTFRNENIQVCSLLIENILEKKKVRDAYVGLAQSLGVPAREATRAYKNALKAQQAYDGARAREQAETLALLERLRRVLAKDPTDAEPAPVVILMVAHPYIAHDRFIAGDIVSAIEKMGAHVIFADETDHELTYKKSFELSDTLPWLINRELAGSILELQSKVDGIVLVSAFPCGPDSMFDDAIMRSIQGTPILNLMIDAQSGSAGVQTRIESFIDILTFKSKGGYLHGRS